MSRTPFAPSTSPVTSAPSQLLLFIQQAQMTIVYNSAR